MDAAVAKPCCASAALVEVAAASLEPLVDDAVELPVVLDAEDEFEELEELEALAVPEALAVGAVGANAVLPTPNPSEAGAVAVPPIVIVSLLSRLVMTSWPLALSEAVTFALVGRSTLRALIRSPTVSLPVDT